MIVRFWHVFTVPLAKERAAELILRKKGLTCCVPTQLLPKRPRRGGAAVSMLPVPVLPRHVFVALSGEVRGGKRHLHWEGIATVLSHRVILGYVGFNGEPGVISDTVMLDFLKRLAEPAPVPPQFHLQRGAKVAVKRGPFAELKATVLYAGSEKAKILLHLFGRSCETLVSIDQLEEITVAPSTKVAAKSGKFLQEGSKSGRRKLGRSVPSSGALELS